jgi:biopolymer transport protein TolR
MSMSRRARRMLTRHIRHRADADLNLIPMIDILSVMVSFLLVYSTEVEVIQNTKAIQIPQSVAEQRPRQTVVVMVTPTHLLVQGKLIADIVDLRASTSATFQPLAAELQVHPLIGASIDQMPPEEREITIMADKSLPYDVIKKVMTTCTAAQYGRISLAVMQKEKAVQPGTLNPS